MYTENSELIHILLNYKVFNVFLPYSCTSNYRPTKTCVNIKRVLVLNTVVSMNYKIINKCK